MEQSYKEKYEQAIAKAKEQYNYPCMRSCMGILEEIFPELKESEDEKVRKDILAFIRREGQHIDKYKWHKWIAWLEKQAERKTPQWMIDFLDNYRRKIGCSLDHDEARDVEGKILCIMQWLENQGEQEKDILEDAILDGNEDGLIAETIRYKNEKQAEQKFEMKTAEESLGIDSDTYNKIVDECLFGEQKPEENKGNIGGISPNSEWSEEDEKMFEKVILHVKKYQQIANPANETGESDLTDWLKSLRPQNSWKPSDEQMDVLRNLAETSIGSQHSKTLISLYDDLKKL